MSATQVGSINWIWERENDTGIRRLKEILKEERSQKVRKLNKIFLKGENVWFCT